MQVTVLYSSFEKKCDDAIAKLSLFKKEMIEKATIDKDVKQKIILEEVKKLNLLQVRLNIIKVISLMVRFRPGQ